jgi:putative glycosyltransferase (TIGR04348 family)
MLEEYGGEHCDLLIALHALRSFPSIERYRSNHREAPLILALTGTDLYGFINTHAEARLALDLATRIIVLQRLGLAELPEEIRFKTRVIYQSVPSPRFQVAPQRNRFDVCVLGHLRPVKDPFRTALAARLMPPSSHLRVLHLGAALSDEMAKLARQEAAVNPRYLWRGNVPHWKALRVLARCRLLVLTSELEGGANVLSEAVATSVPVVSSRIAGSIGLLGEDYPGYFPVGETQALFLLLQRAEVDSSFYETLQSWCGRLKPLIDPARERQSWIEMLRGLQN